MVDINCNINKQYVVAAMKANYAHQDECSHQVKGLFAFIQYQAQLECTAQFKTLRWMKDPEKLEQVQQDGQSL